MNQGKRFSTRINHHRQKKFTEVHLKCIYSIGYSVYCCFTQKSISESENLANTSVRLSPAENCFLTQIVGEHLANGVASGVYYNPILIIGLLVVTSFCVLG